MDVLKFYDKDESQDSSLVDTMYDFSADNSDVLDLRRDKIERMNGLAILSG